MLTRLAAFQHADTAFPSGSFAFSNGIEGLLALPLPFERASLATFVEATLRHRWAGTDRLALVHAHRAGIDIAKLCAIDQALEAATLSAPFRTGSRRAGRAMLTTHHRLATEGAAEVMTAVRTGHLLGHLPVMQGCLWRAVGIGEADAAAMAGYQMIAGLLSATVRLGRIGAIEAQDVVRKMLPVLDGLLEIAVPSDANLDLQSFAPLADIAAIWGATSDTKLFSN